MIRELNHLNLLICSLLCVSGLYSPPQVMPVNGISWSEESVEWFHTMVRNRTLYARLYPQGCEVTVELFFERGKIGAMRCS